jgi:hypothetical protein
MPLFEKHAVVTIQHGDFLSIQANFESEFGAFFSFKTFTAPYLLSGCNNCHELVLFVICCSVVIV